MLNGFLDGSNTTEDPWLPVEDDILICMQNAASDPHFIHTLHWLNNAKGLHRTVPRSANQAKGRYQQLCASGRKDARLKDQNVIRTIAKLKRTLKSQQQQRANAATSSSGSGNGGMAMQVEETSSVNASTTSTSASVVSGSNGSSTLPSNNPVTAVGSGGATMTGPAYIGNYPPATL